MISKSLGRYIIDKGKLAASDALVAKRVDHLAWRYVRVRWYGANDRINILSTEIKLHFMKESS